jgi:hypothetical protein
MIRTLLKQKVLQVAVVLLMSLALDSMHVL